MNFCHKLWFSISIQCCKSVLKNHIQRNWVFCTSLTFLIHISLQPSGVKLNYSKIKFRILSLKYLSSTTLGCEDKGIRKFEFVVNTHFVCPGPDVTGPFDRPKFSAPIWLDEIQNNKIFNKQRNLLGTVNRVKINIKWKNGLNQSTHLKENENVISTSDPLKPSTYKYQWHSVPCPVLDGTLKRFVWWKKYIHGFLPENCIFSTVVNLNNWCDRLKQWRKLAELDTF